MKKIFILFLFTFTICLNARDSLYIINNYEKTLSIYTNGWKLYSTYPLDMYNLTTKFFYIQQSMDHELLSNSITSIALSREFDFKNDSQNFIKGELKLKNYNYFDPLLKYNYANLKESYYHIFNASTYFKFAVNEQIGDFINSDILDYYRFNIFAKIIKRADYNNSIFLSFRSFLTLLPNWEIENNRHRTDVLSSLYLSFTRYLASNFFFTLRYQLFYNYSTAKVSQVAIKYYIIVDPSEEETRKITTDFYNYLSHVLSVDLIKYFSRNLYSQIHLKFLSKEYSTRQAYFENGDLKKEKEKDFNIESSISIIYNGLSNKHLTSILELKTQRKTSNNDYNGYYYYNINKYYIEFKLIYNFDK